MTMTTRRLIAPILAAVFVAACGGDKGNADSALATDTSLNKDLALAGRDSAAQPQLTDVPAKTATKTTPATKTPTKTASTKAKAPAPTKAAPGPTTGMINAGTALNVRADAQLCTNTHKVGDRLTATVNQAVLQELYIQPLRAGSPAARVTRSGTDAFFKVAWPESEFISFPDDKGKPVFARVYKPLVAHPNKPAVMEIHGAGYAQGVHKTFANSAQTSQYLTSRGVTYVQLDYRGSAGYGRNMRTDIYRSMGDRDVNSAIALIPVLQQRYNVNPAKVGLFGCSYGGFFTLMALFKHPGVFQAGAAQCSVTDWAHYNQGYTARILNGSPAEDTAAYKASSPIYHAAGLKDRLLLQHGLVDNNVQYQDAVRLVQRLMELGKDFEFVTYPIDAHGWQSRWARLDSQRRVMKLWDETLLKQQSVMP